MFNMCYHIVEKWPKRTSSRGSRSHLTTSGGRVRSSTSTATVAARPLVLSRSSTWLGTSSTLCGMDIGVIAWQSPLVGPGGEDSGLRNAASGKFLTAARYSYHIRYTFSYLFFVFSCLFSSCFRFHMSGNMRRDSFSPPRIVSCSSTCSIRLLHVQVGNGTSISSLRCADLIPIAVAKEWSVCRPNMEREGVASFCTADFSSSQDAFYVP